VLRAADLLGAAAVHPGVAVVPPGAVLAGLEAAAILVEAAQEATGR
jgi:hypothetical protein